MLFGVVCQVAALAPVPEVVEAAVFRRMVKVPGCKNNAGASDRVALSVMSPTIRVSRASLAAISATGPDQLDNLFPVIRVSALIFRLYRHWHPKVYVSAPRS